MEKLKLGIVGCGFLGNIIVDAFLKGYLKSYELVGVTSRSNTSLEKLAQKGNCKACKDIDELLLLKPDYVVEVASPTVVKDIAEKVLKNNSNLIVVSIGAFADEEFYNNVQKVAIEMNKKVHIVSGAVGGFDVLRTTTLMSSNITASITTEKGPASLSGTPLFSDKLMEDSEKSQVFSGTAKDAIALLPTKVNVAVATSLATAGPQNTKVTIKSVPNMIGDDHKIEIEGDEIHAVVDIYSKTSAIAGWSVVSRLINIVSPIEF